MPLPKSCSIAARVTEAYAEAWSVVLHECWGVKPPRDEPLPSLVQLLPFIRQLLTCCACAGLLEDAMVSLSCGHCYCAKCQLGTPLLKIQCRQCKERTGLVAENQIRIVVTCYRHMCHVISEYLNTTPSASLISGKFTLARDREIPDGFNPVTEILAEVVEGVKVSRTVLLVLPPPKYLNPKPPPDPPTSKKDQNSPVTNEPPSCKDPTSAEESDLLPPQNEERLASNTNSPSLPRPTSHKKKAKRDRKKGEGSKARKRPTLHTPTSSQRSSSRGQVESAWFHGDVDFVSGRPAPSRGTMRLFASLKLLRVKQATLCGPEQDTDLQVEDGCIDKQFVSLVDSAYRVRQDLPSSSLLPPSQRPQLTCLPILPPSLLPPKTPDTAPAATSTKKTTLRTRCMFTPRSKFKVLQPRYRSPYLHPSPDSQPRKHNKPTPPELKKSPNLPPTPSAITVGPPGPLALSPSVGPPPSSSSSQDTPQPPAKKKKRGPMTPGHWRCRCGTNNPQTFDRICARGKCPCFVKNIPCQNCLCRHCKNPFNHTSEI